MYDRNGKYQDLMPVNVKGFKTEFIDQEVTKSKYNVTVVADKEATDKIVDRVQADEAALLGGVSVNYDSLPKEVLSAANKSAERYAKAK